MSTRTREVFSGLPWSTEKGGPVLAAEDALISASLPDGKYPQTLELEATGGGVPRGKVGAVMSKFAAFNRACELWANSERVGVVTLRQKKSSPRFLVGHQKRCTRIADAQAMIVMGASDESWEDAFAKVAKCPCEGDYCTNPDCDVPEFQYSHRLVRLAARGAL